jgi:hypothetical protein
MNRRRSDDVEEGAIEDLDDAVNERMEEMSSRRKAVCNDALEGGWTSPHRDATDED